MRGGTVFGYVIVGVIASFVLGFAAHEAVRADSIPPDLSALPTAVSAAQTSATSAAGSANTAQTSASQAAIDRQTIQVALASIQNDFAGTFTIATLPDPATNMGRRVWVSDASNGQGDEFRAVNGCWVRQTVGGWRAQSKSIASTIVFDGIADSPEEMLVGTAVSTSVKIAVTNACSMPAFDLSWPAGAFGATGSLSLLGLKSGVPSATVGGVGVTASWARYNLLADGSAFQRTAGPTLP